MKLATGWGRGRTHLPERLGGCFARTSSVPLGTIEVAVSLAVHIRCRPFPLSTEAPPTGDVDTGLGGAAAAVDRRAAGSQVAQSGLRVGRPVLRIPRSPSPDAPLGASEAGLPHLQRTGRGLRGFSRFGRERLGPLQRRDVRVSQPVACSPGIPVPAVLALPDDTFQSPGNLPHYTADAAGNLSGHRRQHGVESSVRVPDSQDLGHRRRHPAAVAAQEHRRGGSQPLVRRLPQMSYSPLSKHGFQAGSLPRKRECCDSLTPLKHRGEFASPQGVVTPEEQLQRASLLIVRIAQTLSSAKAARSAIEPVVCRIITSPRHLTPAEYDRLYDIAVRDDVNYPDETLLCLRHCTSRTERE